MQSVRVASNNVSSKGADVMGKTENRKRVLISTWAFPPHPAGNAIILYELLRHLPQEQLIAVHTWGDPPRLDGPKLNIQSTMVQFLGSPIWTWRCMRRAAWLFIPFIRRAS